MTNLETIMNIEAFKIYIEDPEDLYVDASLLDRWKLVLDGVRRKRISN